MIRGKLTKTDAFIAEQAILGDHPDKAGAVLKKVLYREVAEALLDPKILEGVLLRRRLKRAKDGDKKYFYQNSAANISTR